MIRTRLLLLCVLLLAIVAAASPARALIGTIDDVPASTLLLPYFEVDLDNADHLNTLFSINNASASATLAHVTVWSTWSIPVLDFDVYLTGFDVQTINLGVVLINGVLPRTASTGQDPAAGAVGIGISPKGPISQDINFASCTGTLPYAVPAISPSFKTHLRAVLTGKKSPIDGTCAGQNYGDNVARGYVTIDVTNACSQLFPSDTGYFVNGGGGIAGNRNIIWGDYFYVDQVLAAAQGETLVHVEAAPGIGISSAQGSYPPAFVPGNYTFYGRYVSGTAIDNREPLATTFGARYILGGGFDGGTSLIVWRDSKFPPGASCVTGPNYGDLFQQQIVAFDEEENPFTVIQGGPSGEPVPGAVCIFCDEAQRVPVGPAGGVETPFQFGWLYLNLNHATTRDATLGPGYINIAQNWVTVSMTAHEGHYAVGFDAIQFDNASRAVSGGVVLPVTSGIP
ncbi:MAG TPA: hypothetical protein VN923_15745 [Thermoanaerobaculia bacterium]|nr:hypothetical protein [Thermoanaerobaculia bacterium]